MRAICVITSSTKFLFETQHTCIFLYLVSNKEKTYAKSSKMLEIRDSEISDFCSFASESSRANSSTATDFSDNWVVKVSTNFSDSAKFSAMEIFDFSSSSSWAVKFSFVWEYSSIFDFNSSDSVWDCFTTSLRNSIVCSCSKIWFCRVS